MKKRKSVFKTIMAFGVFAALVAATINNSIQKAYKNFTITLDEFALIQQDEIQLQQLNDRIRFAESIWIQANSSGAYIQLERKTKNEEYVFNLTVKEEHEVGIRNIPFFKAEDFMYVLRNEDLEVSEISIMELASKNCTSNVSNCWFSVRATASAISVSVLTQHRNDLAKDVYMVFGVDGPGRDLLRYVLDAYIVDAD